jgi:Tol biopolymer transport system component
LSSFKSRNTGNDKTSSNYWNPFVSQDGRKIYFYSNFIDYQYPHPINIYVMNIDGSGLKNLTNDNYWDSHPIVGTVSFYIDR